MKWGSFTQIVDLLGFWLSWQEKWVLYAILFVFLDAFQIQLLKHIWEQKMFHRKAVENNKIHYGL